MKDEYSVDFDYYPRGRVALDSNNKEFGINIPKGLNESIIIPKLVEIYQVHNQNIQVKYTDPTSGNRYIFKLR